MTYPGAFSLEYQQAIEIFINCMLNWDPKKQQPKGKGIFGRALAFAPAHEEQGRRTLHSHWQIWVEDLSSQVREDSWNNDSNIRKKTREAFYEYVDEVMTATYSKPLSFIHNCRELPKVMWLAWIIPSVFRSVTWIAIQPSKRLLTCLQMAPVQRQISECRLST
jgi:hypothetical protein